VWRRRFAWRTTAVKCLRRHARPAAGGVHVIEDQVELGEHRVDDHPDPADRMILGTSSSVLDDVIITTVSARQVSAEVGICDQAISCRIWASSAGRLLATMWLVAISR
jgi:hypothetical protein